jgi:hypothetical protein
MYPICRNVREPICAFREPACLQSLDLGNYARFPDGVPPMVKKICVKPLKNFAFEKLPAASPLLSILLLEEDELPVLKFLDRLPIWLQLIRWREK